MIRLLEEAFQSEVLAKSHVVLHDIGLDVSYTRHHKHTYYLITNAEQSLATLG